MSNIEKCLGRYVNGNEVTRFCKFIAASGISVFFHCYP